MEALEITINGLLREVWPGWRTKGAGPSLVQQSYNAATKGLETAFTQVNELTSDARDPVGEESAEDVPF